MSVLQRPQDDYTPSQKILGKTNDEVQRTLTPFIITLYETDVTEVDIQSFLEAGLRTVRLKIQITQAQRRKLLSMLQTALSWCCEKYDVSTWPIALSIDIPNACIKTGTLSKVYEIYIKEESIVIVTSNKKYSESCTPSIIFIDDPYGLQAIKPGTEVSIRFGEIVMFCTEVIDTKTIYCKVVRGGTMKHHEFVCIRGIKHLKPPLTQNDMDLIAFAKECMADIVTVNSVRYASTVKRVRNCFANNEMPLLVSTICEQEGLDNIDAIIEASDGIILAREFIAQEIVNKHQMTAIQLQISAKCRKLGKPFYISGNILQKTLEQGKLAACDLNDVSNAVLQGAGFVLRLYKDQTQLAKAMHILNSICKAVEPSWKSDDIWRMSMELRMPVNAGEGAVLGSALLAKQTGSFIIILPTVTGRTAKQLAHIAPEMIIVTICSNPRVARQLQLYRGIVAIIYDKKTMKNFFHELEARIKFAVDFGVKNDLLKYGQTYVVLKKARPTSSYADHISIWKVLIGGDDKTCPVTASQRENIEENNY